MLKLLAIDDQSTFSAFQGQGIIGLENAQISYVQSGFEALTNLTKNTYDALLVDLDHNPRFEAAMASLERCRQECPSLPILVVASCPSPAEIVVMMKRGATDVQVKPIAQKSFQQFISHIESVRESRLHDQPTASLPQTQGLAFREGGRMIGQSEAMLRVFELIKKLSTVDTSVLIRGQSGTGKELVARALHFNSPRKDGPFVAVNCGAIPENLIESELFGFEKGTFTGADRKHIGKFQHAEGGTLFLDEIGDISQQMQVKLLRAIQEKTITPVGSHKNISINVRIVSATHKPLEKMIASGSFRTDLFYRLGVMPVMLPSLSERASDIPALCEFIVSKFNQLHSRHIKGIQPDAIDALMRYPWPGNIRELENVIEHAFILENSDLIHADALPLHVQKQQMQNPQNTTISGFNFDSEKNDLPLNYPAQKERFEIEFIRHALSVYGGRINQTAEQTQMTKVTLLRKLDKYKINPKHFQH